jgi:hypothetical protein
MIDQRSAVLIFTSWKKWKLRVKDSEGRTGTYSLVETRCCDRTHWMRLASE